MQGLRTKRHVVYSLHLHLVFVTKYRKRIFSDLMIKRMEYHFQSVCKDFGCRLIESNAERDHVHLLVEPLPQTTPSKLVNSLKGVSSRMLRKEFPQLEKYYWKGGLWSPSYFITSCGGAPLEIVKEYIQNQ
jgi:putative transposase